MMFFVLDYNFSQGHLITWTFREKPGIMEGLQTQMPTEARELI